MRRRSRSSFAQSAALVARLRLYNAQLRLTLRQQGRPITHRALDLLIAATALQHHLTLVTRNTQDYDDIPALLRYQVPW
jgi:predicted nucleic acid-binding protein